MNKKQQNGIVILSGGPFDGNAGTVDNFPEDAEYSITTMENGMVAVYAQIQPRVWGFSHLTKDKINED